MAHTPVLLREVVDLLKATPRGHKFGLDVTFGRGGHTRELLGTFPDLQMTALDRDQAAIEYGRQAFAAEIQSGRLILKQQSFHQPLPTHAPGWDILLADLGVSSPQLDEPERGFSFYHDGPLDMRMDQSQGLTAQDIVNQWNEEDLAALFKTLGEIHRPYRVVERIIEQRRIAPFTRTSQLSQLIEKAEGWRKKGYHPATQYFLALRLEVNEELSALRPALEQMMHALADGGRLAVITFHSLEDRIVKYAFKESELGFPVNKKVIIPEREESQTNPRARSAKLRVFQKGERHEP